MVNKSIKVLKIRDFYRIIQINGNHSVSHKMLKIQRILLHRYFSYGANWFYNSRKLTIDEVQAVIQSVQETIFHRNIICVEKKIAMNSTP